MICPRKSGERHRSQTPDLTPIPYLHNTLIKTPELKLLCLVHPKLCIELSDNSIHQKMKTLDETTSCELNWSKLFVDVCEKCNTIWRTSDKSSDERTLT